MSLLHADVAVVGSELCGYAVAALLAHEKKRVVVVDDGEHPDAKALGDRLVPLSTSLWRPPTSGRAAGLMDELGLRQRARHELGEPTGLGLIDDPDLRIVVDVEPAVRERELRRAFGDGAKATLSTLSGWPDDERNPLLEEAALLFEDGFFEKRKAKKRLEKLGDEADPLRPDDTSRALGEEGVGAVVPHLVPYVQWLAEAPTDGVARWLAVGPLARGALGDAKGGLGVRDKLRELFADVVRGHAGDVLTGHRATAFEDSGKKLTQVQTDGQNNFAVRAVIDASTARTLTSRLPEGKRREKTAAFEETISREGDAAIARWLVPKEVLPRGMFSRAAVLSDDDDVPTALLGVYADLPPAPGEKQQKRDDVVAVVLSARCAAGQSSEVGYALDARLERLLPFARERAVARDVVTGDVARLALPGYREVEPGQHALGGRRPHTGFANLFRAGRDLVPCLGLDGELAAAHAVATAVNRVLNKGRGEG
jgi:hypothetical protein